jgi:Fur family ferric uptake transcriptional regulator
MHTQNSFTGALRAHGLRLTPQRTLIMQVLHEADEHLDADGLWQSARRLDPGINLATVYRTLNALSQAGLIQQSFLGERQKRSYYELVDKPTHYHFACLGCGKVLELHSEPMAQAQAKLERRYGVHITNAHVKFEGLCPECLAAEANAAP